MYKNETPESALSRNLKALIFIAIISISFVKLFYVYTGRLVTIDTQNITLSIIDLNSHYLHLNNEQMLAAKCVCSETIGEEYKGKVAVANVIYNRQVNRNQTISEVIYDPGQFDGIKNKYFKQKPTYECKKAVKEIFIDSNFILPLSVEYFHNRKLSTDIHHVNKVEQYIYNIIGRHTFCHNKDLINKYEPI